MRWLNLHPLSRLRITPIAKDAAARRGEDVHPAAVDDGEFKVMVKWSGGDWTPRQEIAAVGPPSRLCHAEWHCWFALELDAGSRHHR
jgi:hypothetical protein